MSDNGNIILEGSREIEDCLWISFDKQKAPRPLQSENMFGDIPIDSVKIDVDWDSISKADLDPGFIDEYEEYLEWDNISKFSDLPEYYLEENSEKLDWEAVSLFQDLSEEFIEKYSHVLDWSRIVNYQDISEEFIDKHWGKFDKHDIHSSIELGKNYGGDTALLNKILEEKYGKEEDIDFPPHYMLEDETVKVHKHIKDILNDKEIDFSAEELRDRIHGTADESNEEDEKEKSEDDEESSAKSSEDDYLNKILEKGAEIFKNIFGGY